MHTEQLVKAYHDAWALFVAEGAKLEPMTEQMVTSAAPPEWIEQDRRMEAAYNRFCEARAALKNHFGI